MNGSDRRLLVGPFNRVEGDLEVSLEIADDVVQAAYVNSPLYRGFEQILPGKDPRDALVIAPRICGICSVSQSMAAARALADVQGICMPPNGTLATNLILAAENAADHLTHFYLFFMPDFARAIYAGEPWYAEAAERFRATSGTAAREAIPARAGLLHLMGLLAGKWPHTLGLQPGGSTRPMTAPERLRLSAQLAEFRGFLERVTFGDHLENVAALDGVVALADWADRAGPHDSDLGVFLRISAALGLTRLGRGTDRFMSYGAYHADEGPLFAAGVWSDGSAPLDSGAIREDLASAWLDGAAGPLHPAHGETCPAPGKANAYSWCKAPRLGGAVIEVGALARQQVDGHPLVRDLVAQGGGNVHSRVVARLLELTRLVIAMEQWVRALRPGEPFCRSGVMPEEADGAGLVEAARGSLGHWLSIRGGRIARYQIVAPTTWNFSPRDSAGLPGALEQALVGAPLRPGETNPVSVQHIVRSFDPCMVCTVH